MGAWLAVTGAPDELAELLPPVLLSFAVLFWLAGFDIIYSLQDYDFDRSLGLYSIPVRFGVVWSLRLSSLFHALTVIFLALAGLSAGLGAIYWTGIAIVCGILIWEHRLVRPDDLTRINRAFFDLNAYVSVGYFLITLGDLLWRVR
jgi:4-hydroxybenzoate polyprenyltransferase